MKGDCALKSIRIQNVRCLKDTGDVPLAPITLLVGENSAGKSTFLRTFPLFKQSIRKRTDGPILWAGDVDDYVDFGSFEETVTDDDGQANAKSITFQFQFSMPPIHYHYVDDTSLSILEDNLPIAYSITILRQRKRDYVSNLNISMGKTEFAFDLLGQCKGLICIDGKPFQQTKLRSRVDSHTLYPPYIMRGLMRESVFDFILPMAKNVVENVSEALSQVENEYPFQIVRSIGRIRSMHWKEALGAQVGECLCRGFSISDILRMVPESYQAYSALKALLDALQTSLNHGEEHLIASLKLFALYEYFQQIDAYIGSYFRRVHYIAPLRATAERYYRLRNLSIDEVDYQGSNLAMFLDGLRRKRRLSEFQKWTDIHFGFHVRLATKGGHLSVEIALRDSKHFSNLSDTGFGYSQILPIITQLWYLSSKKPSVDTYLNQEVPLVIAIEQPELHLHPALQAKLADAFLASIQLAKENGIYLQLILETHSATIVNYFGRAIAEKRLQKDDVSLVLFIRSLETGEAEVRTSSYDEDGYLTNWPVGFLAPGR